MNERKFLGLLIFSILFLSACKSYQITEIAKENATQTTTTQQTSTEILPSQETNLTQNSQENNSNQEITTQNTSFQQFYPEITYPTYYNGILYDANLRWNISVDANTYFGDANPNGVNYMMILTPEQAINSVGEQIQNNPGRIIPLINPGYSLEETKQALSENSLPTAYENAWNNAESNWGTNSVKGFGKLEFDAYKIETNNYKITSLFENAEEKQIIMDIQTLNGDAQREALQQTVEQYPNITFLLHLTPKSYQEDESAYVDLIKKENNLFYVITGNDILFNGNKGLLEQYDSEATQEDAKTKFISEFDHSYETYVSDATSRYKTLIDAAPTKVVWGTDLGAVYNYDSEVYNRVIEASREFISNLDPKDQSDIAYQNAITIFGKGNS